MVLEVGEEDRNHNLQNMRNMFLHYYKHHPHNTQKVVVGLLEHMSHNPQNSLYMFLCCHMHHLHSKNILHIIGDIWIVVCLFLLNDDTLHIIGGFVRGGLVRLYMFLLYNDL
jgi:hypothetical protein